MGGQGVKYFPDPSLPLFLCGSQEDQWLGGRGQSLREERKSPLTVVESGQRERFTN